MYRKESFMLFEKIDKANTEKTIDAVIKHCSKHKDIDTVLVSSTTGFTAYCLLNKLKDMNIIQKILVFTQYLDDEHHMNDSMYRQLKTQKLVQEVFDVPQKYLNKEIGQAGVDSLRELSHGIKVCVEIARFARAEQILTENQKFVVIAGRVEGADTALVFKKKKDSIKMISILCFSIDE